MEEESPVAVACRFLRGRNALLCAGDFGPVFMDCYLHLAQHSVVLAGGTDGQLKLLLAVLALHAASQPRAVTCAWTVQLASGLDFFAVAENPTGRVTGRVTGRARSLGANVVHAETASGGGLRRRSTVGFAGDDLRGAAGAYYAQSEQRPARFFELGGDVFALVVAQPDCDLAWLEAVGPGEVGRLAACDGSPLLETRHYRFACGCTPGRLAEAMAPALLGRLDEIFGGEPVIRVTCPRCGTQHGIARGDFSRSGGKEPAG
jgi:molecular chaperone Hsp33